MATAALADISPIASFPQHFFLENLAVRADGSILVTVLNHKQLWYVPAPHGSQPVTPVLVHTFDGFAMGIVETQPDIFYVSTAGQATLERFDMRGWVPRTPVKSTRVLTFDQPAGLNGACLLAPRVILLADSLAGLIWRVDLADDGLTATASVWLQHHTMAPDPDSGLTSPLGPQPGINGIRFAARTDVVYYTCTGQKLFMRVAVDPAPPAPPKVSTAESPANATPTPSASDLLPVSPQMLTEYFKPVANGTNAASSVVMPVPVAPVGFTPPIAKPASRATYSTP